MKASTGLSPDDVRDRSLQVRRDLDASARSARWKRTLEQAAARKAKGALKEFSELRSEAQEMLEEHTGISQLSMPPNILVLRRKTVRQFPGGLMVALYFNDKLGQYFSIPYGSPQDGVDDVITPTALTKEEVEQFDEGFPVLKAKTKEQKRAVWMGNFENHVVKSNPQHAGKINWDSAHHLYNTGHTEQDAAKKYLEHEKPMGPKFPAGGHVKESLNEDAISHLRKVKEFHTSTPLRHKDGTQTRVDPTTANALLTVHDALHPDNQKKMSDALEHSKAKFHRMLDFAWKSVK